VTGANPLGGGAGRLEPLIRAPRPRAVLPALVALAAIVLASCSGFGSEGAPTTTTTPARPVVVTAVPAAGAKDVPPDQVVTVSATDGVISEVTIAPAAADSGDARESSSPTAPVATTGTAPPSDPAPQDAGITGDLSADARTWTSSSPLVPATAYRVVASLVDEFGGSSEQQWGFTTGPPSKVFRAILSPGDDKVVGVGMPVIVRLNVAIPSAKQAAFAKLLTVTATPAVTGAWHWFSATELHWRPQELWKAGTKVSVNAAVAGYAAGGGAYGAKNVTTNYSIGEAHVSIVDVNTHKMAVFTSGVIDRVIDVSTGRDAFPTRSGMHVASEKNNPKIMDSSTVGIPSNGPGGYIETVPWSVRISNSGEFVHAASWSTGSQGNSNVSHGCINISPADGEWFYNYTQLGDVVQVNGSPVQLEPTNGIGDWQIPWAQWAN